MSWLYCWVLGVCHVCLKLPFCWILHYHHLWIFQSVRVLYIAHWGFLDIKCCINWCFNICFELLANFHRLCCNLVVLSWPQTDFLQNECLTYDDDIEIGCRDCVKWPVHSLSWQPLTFWHFTYLLAFSCIRVLRGVCKPVSDSPAVFSLARR